MTNYGCKLKVGSHKSSVTNVTDLRLIKYMELKDLIRKYRSIKPNPVWQEKSQAQLLAYFREKFPVQKKGFHFCLRPIFTTLVILVVILFSGNTFLKAVEKSLPGDSLYIIKRVSEKLIFKITAERQKPVFRAKLTEKRLVEAKKLLKKETPQDSEISPKIIKAAQEFQKEVVILKKEIISRTKNSLEIPLFPDFPIRDNKKIVALIQNPDLEKLLAETKEDLETDQFQAALEKTIEIEKIISPAEAEPEQPTEIQEEEPKTETLKKLPPRDSLSEIKPIEIKPIDFKTDLIQESGSFKTDLLRE